MSKNISIANSFLEYRDTPWDKKAFEIETFEILNINSECESEIERLIIDVESHITKDGLIYYRANANNQVLKKILISKGYYIAETSLKLIHRNIQNYDFNVIFKKNLPLSTEVTHDDIKQIKEIAKTAFEYSRFHEDPFLNIDNARKRYWNWIDDLVAQQKELLIYKKNGVVLSFMFYEKLKEDSVNLLLGGSKLQFGQLTPSFWSSVLNYLKLKMVKKIDVMVSAANVTILNIYFMNGFLVKETMFDYHKLIKRKK